MTIETIGAAAVQPQTTQPLQANSGASQETPISQLGEGVRNENASDAFRSVLNNVYETIQNYGSSITPNAGAVADPVSMAKEALLPSPYEIHPIQTQESDLVVTNAGHNESTETLLKSFDHAMSLALLNQVISGISSTTSSLIRQA